MKKIIYIVIILILLVGAYFYFIKPKNNQVNNSETKNSSTEVVENNNNNDTATQTKTYTLAEVEAHATKDDCWTAINGKVYNMTSFIPNHPGGDKILVVCGKDGTEAFENQHHDGQKQLNILAGLYIGNLATN